MLGSCLGHGYGAVWGKGLQNFVLDTSLQGFRYRIES